MRRLVTLIASGRCIKGLGLVGPGRAHRTVFLGSLRFEPFPLCYEVVWWRSRRLGHDKRTSAWFAPRRRRGTGRLHIRWWRARLRRLMLYQWSLLAERVVPCRACSHSTETVFVVVLGVSSPLPRSPALSFLP